MAELASSPSERNLCSDCARYDWRYHLLDFLDNGTPSAFKENAGRWQTGKSSFGGHEYNVTPVFTSFNLAPLSTKLQTLSECSLCRLIVQTLEARSSDDELDRLQRHENVVVYCEFSDCSLQDPGGFFWRFDNPALAINVSCSYSLRKNLKFTFLDDGGAIMSDPDIDLHSNKRLKLARGKISSSIDPDIISNWW